MPKVKSATRSHSDKFWVVVLGAALLILIGALLRAGGLTGDFWLDEVWSWQLAGQVRNVWAIFFELKHDSNHFLTTLSIFLMGPKHPEWMYRLPSFVASIGGLLAVFAVGRRYGRQEALWFLALVAFSYPFIHYATEARGYSFMLLCSVLAFYCLNNGIEAAQSATEVETAGKRDFVGKPVTSVEYRWAAGFLLCCVLGFFSHLSFLYTFVACGMWMLAYRRQFIPIWTYFLLPTLFLWVLYETNIAEMKVGGAPETKFFDSFAEMLSIALGMYRPHWIAPALFLGLVGWAIASVEWKRGEPWFFAGLLVGPALIWAISPDTAPYPRHFLPLILFALLPVGICLASIFRKKFAGPQFAAAVVMSLWLFGGVLYYSDFLKYGRGQYSDAVRTILINSKNHEVSVSSDHDFRNSAMLDYYVHRVPGGDRVRYITQQNSAVDVPDWVILHSFDGTVDGPEAIADRNSVQFRRAGMYRSSVLSGWNWALYQKVPTAEPAAGKDPKAIASQKASTK